MAWLAASVSTAPPASHARTRPRRFASWVACPARPPARQRLNAGQTAPRTKTRTNCSRISPVQGPDFLTTFETLRGILEAHSKRLLVVVDKPGDYQVASSTMKDRIGRPLAVAEVQIK